MDKKHFYDSALFVFFIMLICLFLKQEDANRKQNLKDKEKDSILTELAQQNTLLTRKIDTLQQQISLTGYLLDPQDTLSFARTVCPLDNWWVTNQLNRELMFFLQHRGNVIEAWSNLGMYQGIIKRALIKEGVPEDLVTVFVIENYLRSRGLSSAGADGGPQLMPIVARWLNLRVDNIVDERRDPFKAFPAAVHLLKRNYQAHGNWMLAGLAYNIGSSRLNDFLVLQGSRDFYSLQLPLETQRYGYEMLAIKLMLWQNSDYYLPGLKYQWRPDTLSARDTTVRLKKQTNIGALVKLLKVSLIDFWSLNQHIISKTLPPGRYHVYLPKSKK